MEIKINIDESKFQEVLEKELGAFTQEELHTILGEAFKEYLNKEEVLRKYLSEYEVDRWGSKVPGTSVMDKLVKNVNLDDVFAEPKEKIKEIICEEETLKSMAIELLVNIFKDRFRSAFTQDWSFIEELSNNVANVLMQRQQMQ